MSRWSSQPASAKSTPKTAPHSRSSTSTPSSIPQSTAAPKAPPCHHQSVVMSQPSTPSGPGSSRSSTNSKRPTGNAPASTQTTARSPSKPSRSTTAGTSNDTRGSSTQRPNASSDHAPSPKHAATADAANPVASAAHKNNQKLKYFNQASAKNSRSILLALPYSEACDPGPFAGAPSRPAVISSLTSTPSASPS